MAIHTFTMATNEPFDQSFVAAAIDAKPATITKFTVHAFAMAIKVAQVIATIQATTLSFEA